MDQAAKAIRARWASIRSRRAIATAHDDLESHQRWLDRHCAAWAENVRLCERRLNSRLRAEAIRRFAVGLFLIGPIACLAFLRRIGRENRKKPGRHRIPGLDGALCTGQPVSSNVVSNTETGLLPVRLVVALFAAVIVGMLAAASATTHQEPARPLVLRHLAPPSSTHVAAVKHVERLVPDPISGFAVVAAPAARPVSLAAATIDEMIALTQFWPYTLDRSEATIEAFEVALPTRKPSVKFRAKRRTSPAKPQPKLTLREQLPWLR